MKTFAILLLTLNVCAVSLSAEIAKRRFGHVDGSFTKAEYIDITTNGMERLYIRYGPISDSGVELERTTNNVVVWRVYVRPLGVPHSAYKHDVDVRIQSGKVLVTSVGEQQISEVRALATGAFISRKVDDIRR